MRLPPALPPNEPPADAKAYGVGFWGQALAAAAGAPYLARLMRRDGEVAARLAAEGPHGIVADALAQAAGAAEAAAFPELMAQLRVAKRHLHLALAVGDLAGVLDLDAVTGALSSLADAALAAAVAATARDLAARGLLAEADPAGPAGPIPGLILVAMGKHGARELNYSSDIDVTVFYDRDRLPTARRSEAPDVAQRIARSLVRAMEEVTPDGYVFRTDLRLRPDPASTPAAVSTAMAEAYYQSVGQNWERAAFIKARACAGDVPAGEAFLAGLTPFVWRRHLDYAAIADVQSIKRQILSHHKGAALDEVVCDVKLARGGIRDIELFVQTQQLILGGRNLALRRRRTLQALAALAGAGVVAEGDAAALSAAYVDLRAIEHRIQMLHDEQTHRVPSDPVDRGRLARLCGLADEAAFAARLRALRGEVAAIDGQLFAETETLADPLGSLVFTGVEDSPETLETLGRLGFREPARVSGAIRGWHHGRIRATRAERARELLTALTPRLLRAMAESGEPDAAFARFDAFFSGLPAGVQVLSLFQAQPALLDRLAGALAISPRLASRLARRPALLDAMLDARFAGPLDADRSGLEALEAAVLAAPTFEAALNAARRGHREEAFRIDLQTIAGEASPEVVGAAHANLAEACARALGRQVEAEVERRLGPAPGRYALLALGKFGGRELAEQSDLDLMLVYDAPDGAGDYYARLTQRFITALSAPTEEGELYAVDMALRPSGSKGPVAVRLAAFARYYEDEAWTWELQALTRLRPVAGDEALGAEVMALAERRLRRPVDADALRADIADMRARLERDKPASGFWDFKLAPGGLIEVEFIAQALQLMHAPAGLDVLRANTGEALGAAQAAGVLDAAAAERLQGAWRLYSELQQLLRAAVDGPFTPAAASASLRARLGGPDGMEALEARLVAARAGVRAAFEEIVGPVRRKPGAAP